MNTEFLKLRLTEESETSMTFLEWRTLMNGTHADSNMKLIDAAIKKLDNGKADGFKFDNETGNLQLTCKGQPIGEAVKLDLNEYIKYEFVAELPDEPVEGKTYYLYADELEDGTPLYMAYQYKDEQWIQIGGAGVKTSEYGVAIQSIEGEDGKTKQYLVNADGEPLGEAIVGGGGGGTVVTGKVSAVLSSDNPTSIEYGKDCNISFWWSATYEDGSDNMSNGTIIFQVEANKKTITVGTKTLPPAPVGGSPITFNFNEGGTNLRSGQNTLIIKVTDSEGHTVTRRHLVSVMVLGLETDYDWSTINGYNEKLGAYQPAEVRWRATGATGVTFHASLANQIIAEVVNPTVARWQTLTVDPTRADIGYDPHGVYRLRMWTTLKMDDGSQIRSSYTEFDVVFAEKDNHKVLIASDYATGDSIQQYTSQNVCYSVYDPLNEMTTVTRLQNGNVFATDTNVGREKQTWVWKPNTSGQQTISVKAGSGENETTKNFIVNVVPVNIPSSVKEYGTYEMKFNPEGHQNSDDNPLAGICKNSAGDEIPCSVNDTFDWVNGGIQYDKNGTSYFCICPGDRLMINYKPFAMDFKLNGGHIKMCFNTTRVSDRNTKWLNCIDNAENGNNAGLIVTPINATIRSEAESLTTRFMYDKGDYFDSPVVEMDINIQKYVAGRRNPLFQFWMEGCPAGVTVYNGGTDGWAQNDASALVIGSDSCEVHLYMMKVSKTSWEDEEIQDDWIMCAPSGEEMVSRYNRNNIYDPATGEIDIDKLDDELIKAIFTPDERLTTGKSDTVTGIMDFYWRGKHWKAKVKVKAQGTSSSKYGEAGLNWDVEIVEVIESDDENMTADGKYSMSGENSIAVNYFNVKVNIASSENWRNMFLAQEFQEYNPHKRPARQKDPRVRDTMEFHPCIILINNTTDETIVGGATSYASGTTGFYGIGNWGNSKKNFEALGEGTIPEFKEHEALLECSDNELSRAQEMQEPLPDDDATAFGGGAYYEFRYPKSPTDVMKQDFRNFVAWVASTTTEDAYVTGEPLETPYVITDGVVKYMKNASGATKVVYDLDNVPRKVINPEGCHYDVETLIIDGEAYKVLPIDEDGNEIFRYSYDTKGYRLDKFRTEFDDHLIFESCAHHYLETLANIGCDNREKNVFWGTEDGIHYHVDFAYDKDTNLGVNNSGNLVQDFGYEDIDNVDGKNVFNGARQTVWYNMRQLFDRSSDYFNATFYQKMRSVFQGQETAGMWNTVRRIKKIKSYVDLIPEAIWRDDYVKKYGNPYTENGTTLYIAMSNGNCLDQACQIMAEQELYMQSMWLTDAGGSRSVRMTVYTPNDYAPGFEPSTKLTLKAYNKGYLVVEYGTEVPPQVRCNAGDVVSFDIGKQTLNDVKVYIPSAQNISEIDGIATIYPYDFNGSALKKCTKLTVGAGDGYYNAGMITFSLGDCQELRELDMRGVYNSTNALGTLDVSKSKGLETLLAQGSGFSGVDFAPGGELITYHGSDKVSSLTAKSLVNVEVFDLQDYTNVSRINITDSPSIDTKTILEMSPNVARVRLTGIDWNLDDTSLLNRLYNLKGLDGAGNDTDRAVLTGQCYVARARESELEKFRAAWTQLEITCGEAIAEHKVTYANYDGETLLVEVYEHGERWTNPVEDGRLATPVRPGSETKEYKFKGWDSTPVSITEDITLTAVYEEVSIVYITFRQPDETEIFKQRYAYGAAFVDPITAGLIETPTQEPTTEYSYVFAGWDTIPTYVTDNITIYATYTRTSRWYTVKWYSYGNSVLCTKTVAAHASAAYDGTMNITRPSVGDVQYLWLGEWDQDTTDVVSDMNVYPVFMRCELPPVRDIPSGYYIYSDDTADNSVYTKEEFAAIVLSDQCKQYLAVGNRIKMKPETSVISDGSIVFSLHAFNHYKLADGTGAFAKTTWYAVGYLNTTKQMNSVNTNVGGWDAAPLRGWLNNTLFPTLPLFWRCLIKQVEIRASAGNKTANILTSKDYLYLMSLSEVGSQTGTAPYKDEIDPEAENMAFALYTNDASRIKYNFNGEGGTASNWWLRSPYASSDTSFYNVYSAGNTGSSNGAANSFGVVPGFSI